MTISELLVAISEKIVNAKSHIYQAYKSVREKGGIVPLNQSLANLSAAIDTIEKNTQKIKFTTLSFRVGNDALDADGLWRGAAIIDVSPLKSFRGLFLGCTELKGVDVSEWNTQNVTDIAAMFSDCRNLSYIDTRFWDCSQVTSANAVFRYCVTLLSCIGNMTIDEVLANNVSCFNGLKVSSNQFPNTLDRASLRAIINGLADLTDQTTQTLDLGVALIAKLTEEDIAIAVNKNWTLI